MLSDSELLELNVLAGRFGNKLLTKHETQRSDLYVLDKAYLIEDEIFVKNEKPIFRSDICPHGNVVNSHVLYMVKQNDYGSLKLQARIGLHGIEDDLRHALTQDCTICPSTGLNTLEFIASIHAWNIYKADEKSAFLQTSETQRQVFLEPYRKSYMRAFHLWLLLAAAYGFVNVNAK